MKVGDLVKPKIYCGGLPGELRCKTALIISMAASWDTIGCIDGDFEVLCKCGTSWQRPEAVEIMNENR